MEKFGDGYSQYVKKVYDEMADEYEKDEYEEDAFFVNDYRVCNEVLKKICRTGTFNVAVDVGCGTGLQTFQIIESAKLVVGYDLSLGLLEKARKKKLSGKHDAVKILQADATKAPLKSGIADIVLSYGDVLSHIPDYGKAIAEMSRICKPGGIVTFQFDNKWYPGIIYAPKELLEALKTGDGQTRRWAYSYDATGGSAEMTFKTFSRTEIKRVLRRYSLEPLEFNSCHVFSSLIPPRYQYPKKKHGFTAELFKKIILGLGRIDSVLKSVPPFSSAGYDSIVIAKKTLK